MTLVQDGHGAFLAPDNNENTIFDVTPALNNWSSQVFINALQSGDTITIKIYVDDVQAGTEKIMYSQSFTGPYNGAGVAVGVFLFPIQCTSYKLTLQQSAGTLRTFNWVRYKQ